MNRKFTIINGQFIEDKVIQVSKNEFQEFIDSENMRVLKVFKDPDEDIMIAHFTHKPINLN